MQRKINNQLQNKGMGTKAQQALKLQHEQSKIERKVKSKKQRETVYLLLMQIGCFHIYKNFFQSCNKSHLAVQIWCGKRDTYFSLHSERGV